jgi:5'-nucleotidase
MRKKPLILVTNDDGITAGGIKQLIEIASEFGEVVVVAPNSPQSAKGHAITISQPLRINEVHIFDGIKAYECSGTPVDCVKLAKHHILKDRKVDLCVSGINHGSNASINIVYSGTMSAAMEASLEGIDAIGFSLLDYSSKADFSQGAPFVREIIKDHLNVGRSEGTLINVNIPKLSTEHIKGVKVCRQARGTWQEDYKQAQDPSGRDYFWLAGNFVDEDHKEDTDLWALENGYISVVPSTYDLTKYDEIDYFKRLEDIAL